MNFLTIKDVSIKWNMSERKISRLCRANRVIGAKKSGITWLIPETATMPIDKRTKENKNDETNQSLNQIKYSLGNSEEEVIKAFERKYSKIPHYSSFTPYRICPLGAHIDHNLGKITGFALDKGIYIAYGPKMNGIIEISSMQFPKRAQWFVSSTPTQKEGDWADHLRGATIALNKRYPLRIGLSAVLNGELPIGGLSSSAAVIITFISALAHLNNITLTRKEMIDIAQEAENKYVGVSCGKLDQSCEVYCRKDSLLFMDLKNDKHEVILQNTKMKPYEIVIFFSGLERSLASSKFNMRVDELRSAAYAVEAFANMNYGKFNETNMRDVPEAIFKQYEDRLPLNWRKRAHHFYGEMSRVEQGVEAWKNGDIELFGKLIFESGKSSIENWETGSPELIKLYEIMTHVKGIYGGRFSGAGFKGCCMAIINPNYEKEILSQVKKEYLETFPELKEKYSAHICHTADGVHIR